MHCDTFMANIDAYVNEELDETTRQSFREHLGSCRACREQAIAADPTLLFAVTRRQPADPAQVEACATAVSALIHQERLVKNMRPRVPRWLMAAAAVLVIMVGAATVWQRTPTENTIGADASVAEEIPDSENAPPRVEVDMAGEGVRVYQFAQEKDDNTAVCFIVNSAMEL